MFVFGTGPDSTQKVESINTHTASIKHNIQSVGVAEAIGSCFGGVSYTGDLHQSADEFSSTYDINFQRFSILTF
jgi:hypothetical protein